MTERTGKPEPPCSPGYCDYAKAGECPAGYCYGYYDEKAAQQKDYEVIGTTYDGVKVLAPKAASKVWTPEEARRAIKAAMKGRSV